MKDKTCLPYLDAYANNSDEVELRYGQAFEDMDSIVVQSISFNTKDLDYIIAALRQLKREAQ